MISIILSITYFSFRIYFAVKGENLEINHDDTRGKYNLAHSKKMQGTRDALPFVAVWVAVLSIFQWIFYMRSIIAMNRIISLL